MLNGQLINYHMVFRWGPASQIAYNCHRRVSPEMKNKLIVSQSILWATALLVVALVDDTQYTLFLLALLATVAVVNLNKDS